MITTTTFIHPSAVIEEGAIIGEGSYIGPFCVIGKNVKMGKNNHLKSHVIISGPCEIGDNNTFYQFCSIAEKSQDLKYIGEPTYAKIGNNNTFRESVTIHRGTAPNTCTIFGNNCNLLAFAHVAHDCAVGDNVVMSNSASLAGHVEVGDCAIIGGFAVIIQFLKVGTMAMVGASSKIVQDVMPYCIAEGAPAAIRVINKIGLERNGVTKENILEINRAFKRFFLSEDKLEEVCIELGEKYPENPYIQNMIKFAKESKKGLVR